jgi:hypothetical protein
VSADDRAAEYAATAEAWRAFCSGRKPDTISRFNLDDQPVAVVLLAALAEPPLHASEFTGDVIADALGGLRTFVHYLDDSATIGGGGGIWLYGYQLDTLSRHVDAVLVLRGYERAHLSGEKGGAP